MITPEQSQALAHDIKTWGQELGFAQVAITDIDMSQHGERLIEWLDKGYHGEMAYMADHDDMRYSPRARIGYCGATARSDDPRN